MSPEQFSQFVAQGYNRIPIIREVLADLDTPLSAYLKLAKGAYSFLLESVHGGEKWGRYSIIGLPAQVVIRITGDLIQVSDNDVIIEQIQTDTPLKWLAKFQQQYRVPKIPDLPLTGGLVGYFSYDTVRYIEPRLQAVTHPDPLKTPDILLMVCEEIVVFDNLKGKLHLIVHANPATLDALPQAEQRLETLVKQLKNPLPPQPASSATASSIQESDFKSVVERADFEQAVEKAKSYIVDGDIMQVVLSQRLAIPYTAPPLNIYRVLRYLNPSPYLYYLDLADFHIVGSSPEILVCLNEQQMTVRPIAGTRPRGKNQEEDQAFEQELLTDPKELAEHLMLIDLGRNDVGRVSQIGTVQLTEKMVIERYSHVMHIVSNVTGQLREELTALDALKAALPAGTLSGAPKIRAMEIIDELEPVKRGIYGGAVGYLAWHGDMDTAIAIRTAVIKNKTLYIQVGAGIVADSIPANEWEETMNKGRAMFKAVAMASTLFGE